MWGTASGAPSDPDRFRNLRKAKVADLQVGAKTLRARPRELLAGERDSAWQDVVLAQAPEGQNMPSELAGRSRSPFLSQSTSASRAQN